MIIGRSHSRGLLVAALLLSGAVSTPAAAQHEDIRKRIAAMDECAASPYNLGYATYDICVDATYDASLRQPDAPPPNREPVEGTNDPFDFCYGTRIEIHGCRN